MKFTVITAFPHLIENFASEALLGSARRSGKLTIDTVNPRQFTLDTHQTIDDKAFGGSDGMVMKVEPLSQAVQSLAQPVHVVVLSPQGRQWSQSEAQTWAENGGHVALVCGRYAGIDNRFTVTRADEEISIGDYVLCGGELAACVIIESVARLLPEVLGNEQSAKHDTFSEANGGWLECPQFTRPREAEGLPVPAPLLSGHHAKIAEFEKAVSMVRTMMFRPDLVASSVDLGPSLTLLQTLTDPELHALGLTRDSLGELV